MSIDISPSRTDGRIGTDDEPAAGVHGKSPSAQSPSGVTRRGVLRSIVSKPLSLICLAWLILISLLCCAAPLVAPHAENDQDLTATFQGPSGAHLLGTDALGRDLLSRLLYGGRITLLGVVIATAIALALGSLFGIVAGYRRKKVDSAFSAVSDILMSIPILVILLSVSAVTSQNIWILMTVVGVLLSAPTYRVFRASTLVLREELYVTAAKTSGLSDAAILRRHILPSLGSLLMVQAAVVASVALVAQIGLGFLNIDVRVPAASWGNMVSSASQTIYKSVWPLIPPASVIALTVLAFSILGDVAQQTRTRMMSGSSGRRTRRPPTDRSFTVSDTVLPEGTAGTNLQPDAALSVRDLTVSIVGPTGASTTLVDRVSFDVAAGEVVGLVGETGAGKSVTSRALLGVFPGGASVRGSVRYCGRELLHGSQAELKDVRGRSIAFVGQDPSAALSPSWRVGSQLVEIVRRHQGVSRAEGQRIARDLLSKVRIPDPDAVAKLYPFQMSGGMVQRAVIAIALAGNPEIIVADEPTTALDVSTQMEILNLLRGLQKERSLAVLLVTHDWGVVADICDRAIVMYAGQVVEEATVDAVFQRPRHPYTIALRGADPHVQAPGTRLRTIPGRVPPPGTWPIGCRFAARCDRCLPACTASPIELSRNGTRSSVRCVRADEPSDVDA